MFYNSQEYQRSVDGSLGSSPAEPNILIKNFKRAEIMRCEMIFLFMSQNSCSSLRRQYSKRLNNGPKWTLYESLPSHIHPKVRAKEKLPT